MFIEIHNRTGEELIINILDISYVTNEIIKMRSKNNSYAKEIDISNNEYERLKNILLKYNKTIEEL